MEENASFDHKKWAAWVQEHENEPVSTLALRYGSRKEVPLQQLLVQVRGRQVARQKLPTFYACPDIRYPDLLILEQCSSEAAAAWKAEGASGKTVADLTGGLGIDTLAFARVAKRVYYCEPDPVRCDAARHNFSALGMEQIVVMEGTAEETAARLLPDVQLFFLDPSRRSNDGRKVFLLSDLSPDIVHLRHLLLSHHAQVMVKLAPMLDIREGLRQLPETIKVDVISRKNECRELVFTLADSSAPPEICCTDTDHPDTLFCFDPAQEQTLPLPVGAPKDYLFEPNAAVRKAGPWRSLADRFGLKMLHPNSHLFTGSVPVKQFPGRVFRIEQVMPYRKDTIRRAVQGGSAQLVFYNFPVKAQEVTKALQIPSGEPKYLFFTVNDTQRPVVVLAERIDA